MMFRRADRILLPQPSTIRSPARRGIALCLALVVLAGCGSAVKPTSVASGAGGEEQPQKAVNTPSPVAPSDGASLQKLDLRGDGYALQYSTKRQGSQGNPVFLQMYVADEAAYKTPGGLGHAEIAVNAAYVKGLSARVKESTDNLAVPPGTPIEGQEIAIGGSRGLVVTDDIARLAIFTIGDWRVQVSVTASVDDLSDDALVAIAEKVEIS